MPPPLLMPQPQQIAQPQRHLIQQPRRWCHLNFSLDFSHSFVMWSDLSMPYDHNAIHKSMTQMRQLAQGKANMTEVTKLQNIAFRIAEDFKSICVRIDKNDL